jgi:hypothetical protein
MIRLKIRAATTVRQGSGVPESLQSLTLFRKGNDMPTGIRARTGKGVKFTDLVDQKFGRLTAIKESGRDKHGKVKWECLCACGNITTTIAGDLRSGKTRSCGCFKREVAAHSITVLKTTHGYAHSPTYNTWKGMIARCSNSKATDYASYGGAGVSVCSAWMKFENFLRDMGERPVGTTLGRTLDRGNYQPGNCFWMKKEEQSIAKRNNHALRCFETNQQYAPRA